MSAQLFFTFPKYLQTTHKKQIYVQIKCESAIVREFESKTVGYGDYVTMLLSYLNPMPNMLYRIENHLCTEYIGERQKNKKKH